MDLELSVEDRMWMSMLTAGLSIREMAQWLGAPSGVISNWMDGRARAMIRIPGDRVNKTNVEYDWLRFGVQST